jgi:hypothetical protein
LLIKPKHQPGGCVSLVLGRPEPAAQYVGAAPLGEGGSITPDASFCE